METFSVPTAEDIIAASRRVKPYIKETPVLRSDAIDRELGAEVQFKMENFMQNVGAFKVRGAMNAVLNLPPEKHKHGVVTESSGNHGAALAYAAGKLGIPCTIVVPLNAPDTKIRNMGRFGAQIAFCEPTAEARKEKSMALRERTGATLIHPYDNEHVIAGQATAAWKFMYQSNTFDAIITPVGGGGLISGTALSAHYFSPATKIIGGEPAGADDAYRSLQSGILQGNDKVDTIADGLRSPLSANTFGIMKRHVDRIVTVTDEEIMRAMKTIWEHLRTVVEPSSAVAYAAALKDKKALERKKVGIILTGGNVDLTQALEMMKRVQ